MRYFYDTEFIEDGKTIDLISIAVVAEDGREFYAQNLECDFSLVDGNVAEKRGCVSVVGRNPHLPCGKTAERCKGAASYNLCRSGGPVSK